MDPKVKILMLKGEKGDPGGSTWGNISGTLSDQTDLETALSEKANTADLGPVCFSNDYDDLNDKPNLAAVATSGSYTDLTNRPNLATVATSGSYTDLTNRPTQLTDFSGVLPVSQGGTGATDGEILRKYTLFSATGGTATDFTLSDSIQNYVKIGVAYIEDNEIWPSPYFDRISYKEFFLEQNVTGYGFGLDIAAMDDNQNLAYFLTVLDFSGTTVTFVGSFLWRIGSSGTSVESRTLKVTDVFGYKS